MHFSTGAGQAIAAHPAISVADSEDRAGAKGIWGCAHSGGAAAEPLLGGVASKPPRTSQWDAVDTSPDLKSQNVLKTFEMAIRNNRRTTRTELE